MNTQPAPSPHEAAEAAIRRAGLITAIAALQRIRPLLDDTRHINQSIQDLQDQLDQEEQMSGQKTIHPPLTEEEFNRNAYNSLWTIPMQQNEDGDHHYAYGHVDKTEFAAAIDRLMEDLGAYDEPADPEQVEHLRAVTLDPGEEWWISWNDEYQDHPLSFPITLLRW